MSNGNVKPYYGLQKWDEAQAQYVKLFGKPVKTENFDKDSKVLPMDLFDYACTSSKCTILSLTFLCRKLHANADTLYSELYSHAKGGFLPFKDIPTGYVFLVDGEPINHRGFARMHSATFAKKLIGKRAVELKYHLQYNGKVYDVLSIRFRSEQNYWIFDGCNVFICKELFTDMDHLRVVNNYIYLFSPVDYSGEVTKHAAALLAKQITLLPSVVDVCKEVTIAHENTENYETVVEGTKEP